MKSKVFSGLVLFFSLSLFAKSALCLSTHNDGYTPDYAEGRYNTVDAVQELTDMYVQAYTGDLFGYAKGLLDGFHAGVLKGPIVNPKITVAYSSGGATFDEGGYSTWLYDFVSDTFTGVTVVDIE